jgi:6-phosphogluconolactonase
MKKIIQPLFAVMLCITAIVSCQKEEDSLNSSSSTTAAELERSMSLDEPLPAESTGGQGGYLYTEGNETGTNNIHIFSYAGNGTVSHIGSVSSGGAGNGMALGSQGALALNQSRTWLYAVNAGDSTISSFQVQNNGMLTLAHTVSSNGATPVSVCVKANKLYVVNAGSSNIHGYTLGGGGTMTPIAGSDQPLSAANAGPAQISFSPNGQYILVTEKMTNKISAFPVNAQGVAGPAMVTNSTGQTPFGFDFACHFMIVSNASGGAPNASTCTSYDGANTGNINDVNGAIANNQTAACWVAVSKQGRYAYVTNTESDNISTYQVSPAGVLSLIHANTVATGDAPIDLVVSKDNQFVFNVNSMSHTVSSYMRTVGGGLNPVNSVGALPPFAAGLVTK